MIFQIITIFPHIFDSYFAESLFKRAIEKKLLKINVINLRDFTSDKHKKVDDSPFGGGPGMVIKLEPVYGAVRALKSKIHPPKFCKIKLGRVKNQKSKIRTILFSTRGKIFDQKIARRLSKYDQLILICGRYEGVDERVAKYVADEEISMGDYVLSGGEIPAMALVEAVSRLKRGFLGKYDSLEDIKGSYPTYTRPPKFFPKKLRRASLLKGKTKSKSWDVPKVLLSGYHKEIDAWRASH
ncbi:MAG: tRNA (guanosine(37)-N1)-methyltransferase TrmD [bacterium]|nr:tRNA (guanosine(37)-N1)-methyltransferase TrmD [bacterium]